MSAVERYTCVSAGVLASRICRVPGIEGWNGAMTKLLERVIAEIEKLPEDAQDAIAARLLADLTDEQEWAARFAATSDAQWERMAAMVRQEIAAGDTVPFDQVFPVQVPEP